MGTQQEQLQDMQFKVRRFIKKEFRELCKLSGQ